MNKSDLSSYVATPVSLSKAAVYTAAVNAVFSAISHAIPSAETVTILAFGTFSTKTTPARDGRNPRAGDGITIAALRTPSFSAGNALRQALQ